PGPVSVDRRSPGRGGPRRRAGRPGRREVALVVGRPRTTAVFVPVRAVGNADGAARADGRGPQSVTTVAALIRASSASTAGSVVVASFRSDRVKAAITTGTSRSVQATPTSLATP